MKCNFTPYSKLLIAFSLLMLVFGPGVVAHGQTVVPGSTKNAVFDQAGAVHIYDIKGAGHVSPYLNKPVADVPGIITALTLDGFYMQDPNGDGNDATSDAIFVSTKQAQAQVLKFNMSDAVLISGTVVVYQAGKSNANSLPIVAIEASSGKLLAPAQGFPLPILIGTTPSTSALKKRIIPTNFLIPPAISNPGVTLLNVDPSGKFDANNNAVDFYTSLEGMRVRIDSVVVVSATNATGDEFAVIVDNGTNGSTSVNSGRFNPLQIIITNELYKKMYPQKSTFPALKVGDKLSVPILGVITYRDGTFKLAPVAPLGKVIPA